MSKLMFLRGKKCRKIINIACRSFFGLFYKKKYLKGKHFEDSYIGWLWAFRGLGSRVFGEHRSIPWPVSKYSTISSPHNINFHPSSINCFQSKGCYFQNFSGNISLGENVWIAPNVGLITANHDVKNLSQHIEGKDIIIHNDCWIGMNSVILPGVELGDGTIVAAGAVVNKSFKEGNCIVAGIPAKIVKKI